MLDYGNITLSVVPVDPYMCLFVTRKVKKMMSESFLLFAVMH